MDALVGKSHFLSYSIQSRFEVFDIWHKSGIFVLGQSTDSD